MGNRQSVRHKGVTIQMKVVNEHILIIVLCNYYDCMKRVHFLTFFKIYLDGETAVNGFIDHF